MQLRTLAAVQHGCSHLHCCDCACRMAEVGQIAEGSAEVRARQLFDSTCSCSCVGIPDSPQALLTCSCLVQILEQVQLLSSQGWEYSLQASYLEVYNETLRDLLAPATSHRQPGQSLGDLNAIRHDPAGERSEAVAI